MGAERKQHLTSLKRPRFGTHHACTGKYSICLKQLCQYPSNLEARNKGNVERSRRQIQRFPSTESRFKTHVYYQHLALARVVLRHWRLESNRLQFIDC